MYTVHMSTVPLFVKFRVLEWLYFVQCRPDKPQTQGFCKSRFPLSDFWVSCHLSYINVLVPSPTRFEVRQLSEQSPNHVLIYLLISKSTSSSISASVSWHWKKPTNNEYTHIENLHQWCSCHRSVIRGMADALEECWPVIMLVTGK